MITQLIKYEIACDFCGGVPYGSWDEAFDSEQAAINRAIESGWAINGTGAHVCDDCSQSDEEE